MQKQFFAFWLVCALFTLTAGCGSDAPEIIEGPVMDNGGFSPEELSGEGLEAETRGDS